MPNYTDNMCHNLYLRFLVSKFSGTQMSQMSHFVTLQWKSTVPFSLIVLPDEPLKML